MRLIPDPWTCIKPGIEERVRECEEHGGWGNVIFQRMSPNILGNVAKHYGKCRQKFQGMLENIPGNIAKHSGECRQTF